MNRKDIINLAHEAQFEGFGNGDWVCTTEEIERFAALVVAAERERIIQKNKPEIERINAHIRALEDAVLAEREACAKVCEDKAAGYIERAERPTEIRDIKPEWARIAAQTCGHVAAAIRARAR